MEWGRLYANLPDDPRVQAAEANGGAAWLLVQSMCYCTRAERKGFIPHTQVEMFGGGAKLLKQRVMALVREQLWIPVDGGYLLNPDIWTEERNLSDSAERKRKADRERIATRRAQERAAVAATESRDSRATCRATDDRDSRGLEERREEKTTTAGLVSQPQVPGATGIDDDGLTKISSALAGKAGRIVTPDETRQAVSTVLGRAERSGKPAYAPVPYVLQAITDEPDVYSLILGEPPSLGEILAGFTPPDGTHPFEEDPDTGLCRACKTPELNWHHPRGRTA